MTVHEFDVAIIGGGLAGSTLARQLRLTLPDLRVGLFERRDDGGFKVGESTVEIAANYLARRLQLNRYLFENHLLKNGLRYFFDSPQRDAKLEAMSEIGTDGYPYHPSFQVDRARLDADLRTMNEAAGIDLRRGTAVRNISVDQDGGLHRFDLEGPDGTQSATARWLVDASGRARVLGKALGLKRVEVGHPMSAVWGRFTGVPDIDQMGPPAWRDRVRSTCRHLSTNHFCYPGYWIWTIPLGRGVVSVGVVGEKSVVGDGLRKPQAFRAFLGSHRAVKDVLAGSELVDVMGYSQLAYGAERYFSEHRFGFTGEAAAFSDPFYSPGSDFIAIENDYLTDLIRRDVQGEGDEALAQCVDLYDKFMKLRFDTTMPIYRGLYSTFGSYELMKLKYTFDASTYYNIWVHSYLMDQHLDHDWVREQLRAREPTVVALHNVATLFQDVEAELRSRGQYYRGNTGEFSLGDEPIDFYRIVGKPRKRKEVLRRLQRSFNDARQQAMNLLGDARGDDYEPLPLYGFMLERSLLEDSPAPSV